jgi:hypothetical protein
VKSVCHFSAYGEITFKISLGDIAFDSELKKTLNKVIYTAIDLEPPKLKVELGNTEYGFYSGYLAPELI